MALQSSFTGLRRAATGFLLLLLVIAPDRIAAGSIQSEIDAILSRPLVSGNSWSVLIERENGDVLYSRAAATPRRPASVTKLFPTAAAFDLLGPTYIWNGERIEIACRPINRNSNNTMADDLFRYLGEKFGNAYSYAEGSRVVREWAASIGMDTTGLILNDGSGLSWDNRINAVQAIDVLRFAVDNYPTFAATLSRACHYGTLGSRFCGTAGAGNVYGKTGTLPNGQTVSLTGFLDYAGQRYYFSFFANNVTNTDEVRAATRQAIDDSVLVLTTHDVKSTVFAPGDWIATTASSLNLRAGPGTGYEIVSSFPQGTIARVRPHAENGTWANSHHWWAVSIYPDGPEGWFAEAFLASSAPPDDWPWTDVIVDNSDPGFSASANWGTADWANDKYGPDYRYRNTEAVTDLARWSADLPGSGSYDVYAWWPAWSNRATATPYIVYHANGGTAVLVDQTQNGGRWNYLGRFTFAHDSQNQVALSCSTTSGDVVMADAVRFVPIDVQPPPERYVLSIEIDGNGMVEKSPDALDYEEGTSVELHATPDAGFSFTGWNGGVESTQNPVTVTMTGPISVTAGFARTFEAWTKLFFSEAELQDESISGHLAAPAGDRVPNLVKYALDLDPRQPAPAVIPLPVPLAWPEAGGEVYLTLTFSHPSDLSDVAYAVELSGDLSDWSELAVLATTEDNDGITTRTYRDTEPYNPLERRFMRLRVTRE